MRKQSSSKITMHRYYLHAPLFASHPPALIRIGSPNPSPPATLSPPLIRHSARITNPNPQTHALIPIILLHASPLSPTHSPPPGTSKPPA